MDKLLLFAGTTEGRKLAEFLNRHQVKTHVCVATEYGEQLIVEGAYLTIHAGRLTKEEMRELIQREEITLTVDATHPYATVVSENIRQACGEGKVSYLRLLRESSKETGDCICVDSVEEAALYLKDTTGNILVTTGSKELHHFLQIPNVQERVYARVLSTPEVAAACAKMGFTGKHLICMQGPFGEDLNTAMLIHVNASWMVTKESGQKGGFEEKMRAAKKAGAKVVMIGRPKEPEGGLSEREVRALLCRRFGLKGHQEIALVGIGMGNPDTMTIEAKKACGEAEVFIGADRMLKVAADQKKPCFVSYRPEEIRDYIEEHPEYEKIAILLSGDVGFYSGAKKLMEVLADYRIKSYSGISSLVYFCGKLGVDWEDVKLLSLHGRDQNLIGAVQTNKKVFALTGKGGVEKLCEKLLFYGLEEVLVSVGESLSYEEERILRGTPGELKGETFDQLSVVLIENPKARSMAVHGIPDEAFLREKVPMTKEEVRIISLGKLQLEEDSIVYDVGAGTGSVSIEMAKRLLKGRVYGIEKKPEAVELICRNRQKFAADNLIICEGLAPEVLTGLPSPTHAFIGGSSGNLREILETIFQKNPKTRIVINAIALETLAETLEVIRQFPVKEVDIVSVSIGKSKEVGRYHMMMGQNPVSIISFTGGA